MKSDRDSTDQSPTIPVSRRRTMRLEAPAGLAVTLSDQRISATVVDIGVGGLGLLADFPVLRGVTYGLTLRFGTRSLTCEARAVHSRRREDGQWLVGLAFVRDDRTPLVAQFVDELTASQIEFPWPRLAN
jgi:PilZ domain